VLYVYLLYVYIYMYIYIYIYIVLKEYYIWYTYSLYSQCLSISLRVCIYIDIRIKWYALKL